MAEDQTEEFRSDAYIQSANDTLRWLSERFGHEYVPYAAPKVSGTTLKLVRLDGVTPGGHKISYGEYREDGINGTIRLDEDSAAAARLRCNKGMARATPALSPTVRMDELQRQHEAAPSGGAASAARRRMVEYQSGLAHKRQDRSERSDEADMVSGGATGTSAAAARQRLNTR